MTEITNTGYEATPTIVGTGDGFKVGCLTKPSVGARHYDQVLSVLSERDKQIPGLLDRKPLFLGVEEHDKRSIQYLIDSFKYLTMSEQETGAQERGEN